MTIQLTIRKKIMAIALGLIVLMVITAILSFAWVRQVEECTIEGAGHLLHIQRSAPVATCLAAFFGRHALAARSTSRAAAEAQV